MSDPLAPDRPGDLAELGLSPKPTVPFDEMPEEEKVEAPVTTAEDAGEPQEGEAPPAREGPPEDQPAQAVGEQAPEQVEAVQEESIIKNLLAQEEKAEESELTQLRQKVAQYEGAMGAKLEALKDEIRQLAAPPEEKPKEEAVDLLNTPTVQAALKHIREEEPEQFAPTLVRIAGEQARQQLQPEIDALKAQLREREEKQKNQSLANQYQQSIRDALAKIKGSGGLAAEIVQDLEDRKAESYLGQKLTQNPYILMAGEDGLRGAVVGIEAELRARAAATQQSTAESVSPSVEASAGGGTASRRALTLDEKPKVKSPEDQIVDDMFSVDDRRKRLPFLDDGSK